MEAPDTRGKHIRQGEFWRNAFSLMPPDFQTTSRTSPPSARWNSEGASAGDPILEVIVIASREWKKFGGHAVSFRFPSRKRPTETATLAWSTRCAPLGDPRIWRSLFKRRLTKALAVDSARELETGRPLRDRSA